MRFTIITPSLNYGHFLGDCLESVASQIPGSNHPSSQTTAPAVHSSTFDHQTPDTPLAKNHPSPFTLEHLIFDAGSTDNSAEVAARFPHATWIQEPDRGMSHAINKGFDRATGDWVMWLNADDRLKPGALAEIAAVLAMSDADVVYGAWDFIDVGGNFLRHVSAPRWSPFVHIHHHCYVGSTAAFYRKATVIDAGHRLREDFHYVMDGEFYARLDAVGLRFHRAPGCYADFRLHPANASQRHLSGSRELEQILAAERQHIESRAIRRAFGITLFHDPYLNGLIDGLLWLVAKTAKPFLKI